MERNDRGGGHQGRGLGRVGLIAVVLGFVGIVLLIVAKQGIGSDRVDLMGVGAALVGSIAWAVGGVYSRLARLPTSPVLTAGLELIVGGSLLLVVALLVGEMRGLDASAVQLRSVGGLVYLIVFGSVIGFTAYIWLLKVVPATRVSTYAYINPVVAVILGSALENERLTLNTILASSLIVLAVYLMLFDRSRTRAEAGRHPNMSRNPSQTRFKEEVE